ncbi:SpoIIE family protein phosphatase [Labilibacter marinus]|uniref:SpoIIE family protein phosphatase n=1 Tax=Labilibacter marinus TaxID=1477105 RepID=UPI0009500B5E|nr:SpoIIE family protein phosphatase [Labilibacter marinus]
MNSAFVIEAENISQAKAGEAICGDAILFKKIKEENRLVAVVADGLGSGVQANISATMTSTMALQFTIAGEPVERTAEFITNTLPLDSKRKVSYSTFSILDINYRGEVKIVEYDNPPILVLRNGEFLDLERQEKVLDNLQSKRNKVYQYNFILEKEDRIIMVSDGVTQCGMGSDDMHFGWQLAGLKSYIQETVLERPHISARELADNIINKTCSIDNDRLKDDASCCVLYYRRPRKLLIVTGPPFHKENDSVLASEISNFNGKKIICGGTTSKIVAKNLNANVEIDLSNYKPGLPPQAQMQGVDLVTEGIITLAKVSEELNIIHSITETKDSLSGQIIRMMLESDEINFISGTRINNAHQDPNLPVELEIRRNVIKRIAHHLENKFLKKTSTKYL